MVSEFVGRQLAEGERLGSNCLIENTREFHTIQHIRGLRPTDCLNARFRTIQVCPKDQASSASYSLSHSGYGDG
jgi:hypothetical protein